MGKMKMKNLSQKWTRISMIVAGMTAMVTLTFNCAPSVFQSAKGGSGSFDLFSIFDKPNAPISLMTAEQTYRSMLNVTGQTAAPVGTAEYNLRFASMSATDSLANINSPLLLASTSLAGEVCNNLLNAEKASDARRFFNGVNFSAGQNAGAADLYAAAVEAMAQAFWGRPLNAEEASILTGFYTSFTTGANNNADLTNDLYLGTCAAMLSSFDSLVY